MQIESNLLHSLNRANTSMYTNMSKFASGVKVRHAGDNASGLAISERMRAGLLNLSANINNSQNSLNQMHTTDGSLGNIQDMLSEMRELAVSARDGTKSASDRTIIQEQMNQLSQGISFSVAHNDEVKAIFKYSSGGSLDVTSMDGAEAAMKELENVAEELMETRTGVGISMQVEEKRLEGYLDEKENLMATEIRIRDVDVARQSVDFSSSQVQGNLSAAMLAQANMNRGNILNLIA